MHTLRFTHVPTVCWLAVSLALVTAGAAAQTTGSADNPRATFRQELAPLALSIKQQVQAVTAELARSLAAELASILRLSAPRSQPSPRETSRPDADRS